MELAEKALCNAAMYINQAASKIKDSDDLLRLGMGYVVEALLLSGHSSQQVDAMITASKDDVFGRYRTWDFMRKIPQIER